MLEREKAKEVYVDLQTLALHVCSYVLVFPLDFIFFGKITILLHLHHGWSCMQRRKKNTNEHRESTGEIAVQHVQH